MVTVYPVGSAFVLASTKQCSRVQSGDTSEGDTNLLVFKKESKLSFWFPFLFDQVEKRNRTGIVIKYDLTTDSIFLPTKEDGAREIQTGLDNQASFVEGNSLWQWLVGIPVVLACEIELIGLLSRSDQSLEMDETSNVISRHFRKFNNVVLSRCCSRESNKNRNLIPLPDVTIQEILFLDQCYIDLMCMFARKEGYYMEQLNCRRTPLTVHQATHKLAELAIKLKWFVFGIFKNIFPLAQLEE